MLKGLVSNGEDKLCELILEKTCKDIETFSNNIANKGMHLASSLFSELCNHFAQMHLNEGFGFFQCKSGHDNCMTKAQVQTRA